jgi:molybdate transport system substrate-binding protein
MIQGAQMLQRFMAIATLLVASGVLHAADIKVLSAGAVEPAIEAFAQQIKRDTGHEIKILFNTAPQIARRLAAGEVYDMLIAPPAAIDQAIQDGKALAQGRVLVGRVGGGVHVRRGATPPSIATADDLKKAVLAADSVVYNTASTGLYLDKLFASMGILEQIKAKTTRYANGAAVLEHVIKGKGNEIGFGAITEIKLYEAKGLSFVGPLPPEVQNYTRYDATMMVGASASDAVSEVLKIMQNPVSKAIFLKAGVE